MARRRLTLEVPETGELRDTQRWYVGELIRQAAGVAPQSCPFPP
jgi:hypothetical protein